MQERWLFGGCKGSIGTMWLERRAVMRCAIRIMVVVLALGLGVQEGVGVEPVLDQEGSVAGNKTWAGWSSVTGPYKSAQQVEPTLRYLFRVEVQHNWNADIAAGAMNLRVLGTYATWLPNDVNVVVLGSKTITFPTDVPQPHDYPKVLTFDFSDSPVDLDGYLNHVDNMYIYLEITGDITVGSGTYDLDASSVGAGSYPRPFYRMTDGSNWVSLDQDMVFRTYGLATLPPRGTVVVIQ